MAPSASGRAREADGADQRRRRGLHGVPDGPADERGLGVEPARQARLVVGEQRRRPRRRHRHLERGGERVVAAAARAVAVEAGERGGGGDQLQAAREQPRRIVLHAVNLSHSRRRRPSRITRRARGQVGAVPRSWRLPQAARFAADQPDPGADQGAADEGVGRRPLVEQPGAPAARPPPAAGRCRSPPATTARARARSALRK